jgi:hypothetical protein
MCLRRWPALPVMSRRSSTYSRIAPKVLRCQGQHNVYCSAAAQLSSGMIIDAVYLAKTTTCKLCYLQSIQ